jgi:superfamily I DNA/RNA helicase
VIRADGKILLDQDINFNQLFHDRDDENEHIKFFKKRKDYYKYYGYADVVFAVVKYFEEKKERIPAFDQVVVDEFQDFNKLEVSLIDLLAEKSPVLLAGDDDQALYAFKSATPEHIRTRHSKPEHGYVSFNLPYCSRCTRVIVDASNDIIKAAIALGRLSGRIEKPHVYFEDEHKDEESEENSKIIHARLHAAQFPWFITKEMGEIAKELRRTFSVLIISPTKVQSRTVVTALRREKGLKNIDFVERKDEEGVVLLDGLKLLQETSQKFGNLGWRIAASSFMSDAELAEAVKKSAEKADEPFHKLVTEDAKKKISALYETMKSLKDDQHVEDAALDELLGKIGLDARALAASHLKAEIEDDGQRIGNPSIRTIPVKATTIQSSKGLAADYVFITHFDDAYFVKDKDKTKITDQDVCNFLVALTRARKKVYLISSKPNVMPTFRLWMDNGRIEEVLFEKEE